MNAPLVGCWLSHYKPLSSFMVKVPGIKKALIQRQKGYTYRGVQNVAKSFFVGAEKELKLVYRNDKAYLTNLVTGEQHITSVEDMTKKLKESAGYSGAQQFFKSTYWLTEQGKADRLETMRENFRVALEQYVTDDMGDLNKALMILEQWTDAQFETFYQYYGDFVANVFNYDDKSVTNRYTFSPYDKHNEAIEAEDGDTFKLLLSRMETVSTYEQLQTVEGMLQEWGY